MRWNKKIIRQEAFDDLYNSSAITWEGLSDDSETLDLVYEFFEDNEFEPIDGLTFYIYYGADMNKHYNLTDDNKYPDDLIFVSVNLDDFKGDIGTIAIKRFHVGARWFDDIVDNNACREREIEFNQ